MNVGWREISMVIAAVALGFMPSVTQAQQEPRVTSPATKVDARQSDETKQLPAARSHFTLKMKKEGLVRTFQLSAKEAKVAEIAAELSRQLDVPVKVSSEMSREKVSVDVDGLPLEGTLRFFAGQQFVDYVAGGDDLGQAKPLAIYLYGIKENPPALNEVVKSSMESVLVQGNTEEGTEEYEKRKKDEPLQISFANNRLSVRAEKQPLSVVIARIASEIGIPFEFSGDWTEIVNTNFKDYPLDLAIRSLSSSVLFYYRSDLTNFEKRPIRLVMGSPSKSAPGKAGGKN